MLRLPLPIVRSCSCFIPARPAFWVSTLWPSRPKELRSSLGRFQVWASPRHRPPCSQPEPKKPVVFQIGNLLLSSCGLSTFANACFQANRPRSRETEVTAGSGTWDLSSLLGCAATWLLLFHLLTPLSLSQIGFEVAFYYRKYAEINYKQRRKKAGKSGLEKKRSWETTNNKPLCTCIWPNLTLSFPVIRRNRNLWASYSISKSQLRCW